MMRARVLVAEDNAEVARQLRRLLSDEFDVVGMVMDGASLLRVARIEAPDALVTDISMPGIDGLQAAEMLAQEGTACRFVFITVHNDPCLVARAARLGACGYVLKSAAGDELVPAVLAVLGGQAFVSPALQRAHAR